MVRGGDIANLNNYNFGFCKYLGRADLAVDYGKRVLAVEPGDSETLIQLVDYYRSKTRPGPRRS